MSKFTSENLPIPIQSENSVLSDNTVIFKLYRNNNLATIISGTVNISTGTFMFLPETITQTVGLTSYVFDSKNESIVVINNKDFSINTPGVYHYEILVTASASANGIFLFDLCNSSNNSYKFDMFTDENVSTTTKNYNINGIISHKKGDIVKLRFSGGIPGAPMTDLTININKIFINITKYI